MRKLALSVAVALSSFCSQSAFAYISIEELHLICKRSSTYQFRHSPETRNKAFYISIKEDKPLIYFEELFLLRTFEKKSDYYSYEIISRDIDFVASKLRLGEFHMLLTKTSHTQAISIDRTTLELTSYDPEDVANGPGICEIVDEKILKSRLSLVRKYLKKKIDAEIVWMDTRNIEKYREHQEKLSKRKF